jgi:tellurite resistance protein TehA-like permease
MNLLYTGPGPAGAVIAAAVAAFLILLAAYIAVIAVIARRARTPVLAQRACRPRTRSAARRAQPAAHPQGGTP